MRELAEQLEKRGVDVRYAIHPVAGRMPGHMNVLLAEANVPYDQLNEMDEINPEFAADGRGARDRRERRRQPGRARRPEQPDLRDADHRSRAAKSVVVIKRSMSPGFAGIDNPLFFEPNTAMLFGDAKESVVKLVAALKSL